MDLRSKITKKLIRDTVRQFMETEVRSSVSRVV